jgi:hypothetical protein
MNGSDHRPLSFCVDFFREYELPTFSRWNIGRLQNAQAEKLLTINGLANRSNGVAEFFKRNSLNMMFLVETWLKPNEGSKVPLKGILIDQRVDVSVEAG